MSILVTRKEYDRLLLEHTDYMIVDWPNFQRDWLTGGVRVIGTSEELKKLKELLLTFAD
jgi:hypothetical protein